MPKNVEIRQGYKMREFKFRAWDTRKKEMFMVNKMTFRTCYDVFRVFGNNHCKDEFHIVNPDDCILMQFTGLKDKNGKEIYEGDIVKYKTTLKYKGETFENIIEWHETSSTCCFKIIGIKDRRVRYRLSKNQIFNHDIEIIGNVYEKEESEVKGE